MSARQFSTNLGGLIGAVLMIALVIYFGDRIDWLADITNDYIASAILTAVGVIGWLVGSRIVGRLLDNGHAHVSP